MNEVTYRLESEQDFRRVVSSLEQSNVPFSTRVCSDSSFPFVVNTQGFGDITVQAEGELELRSLIESVTHTNPLKVGQQTRRRINFRRAALITYTVVVSVMCARYWYLNYRNSEDKNSTFEWSYDGQDLVTINKKTGVRSHKSTDANYDQNFELFTSYSRSGILTAEWKDLNEDGLYEETHFYNDKGELVGDQFDRNNDGVSEEATIIFDDKHILKLFDRDGNGAWDEFETIN